MKLKTISLLICFLLVACAAPAPAAPLEVTRIVEQTVLVTQLITTTPAPSLTPKVIVITATGSPTPAGPTWTPLPSRTTGPTLDPLTKDHRSGFYLIGIDVAAGVWRNDSAADNCYWAITSKTGDILDNHYGMGGGTMYVNPAGYQVEMGEDCGTWTYLGQ